MSPAQKIKLFIFLSHFLKYAKYRKTFRIKVVHNNEIYTFYVLYKILYF
jgi:hypothetical protein